MWHAVSAQACRLLQLVLLQVIALCLVMPILQAQAKQYREDYTNNTDHLGDTWLISENSNSTFKTWNGSGATYMKSLGPRVNITSPSLTARSQGSSPTKPMLSACSPEIYSCQNRCGSQPRTACSCHYTCQVYGNCCEDYADFCRSLPSLAELGYIRGHPLSKVDSTLSLVRSNNSSVTCLGGSLMITSCAPWFVDSQLDRLRRYAEAIIDVELQFDWIFGQLSTHDAEFFVSRCVEPEFEGVNNLEENPVTVNDTGLHFRNFYCAVCNGFFTLQFWLGFGVCSQSELDQGEAEHSGCEKPMVYLPGAGNPNSCFMDSQLTLSGYEHRKSAFEMLESASTANVSSATLVGGGKGDLLPLDGRSEFDLVLDVLNASHPERQNQSDEAFSILVEKCQRLTAYVTVSTGSKGVYKNVYCYKLLNGDTELPSMCEPAVPRLPIDKDGLYKTFWPELVPTGKWNKTGRSIVRDGLNLAAKEFAENDFIFALLGEESLPECDSNHFIIVEGNCLRKAFSLHIYVSFNFERSSLIKGDYQESSKSYISFVSDTMTSKDISPQFLCQDTLETTNELSRREHQGEVRLQCVEVPIHATGGQGHTNLGQTDRQTDEGGEVTSQEPQTVDGEPVTDARVRRYLDFATEGFKAIHSGTDVMKLPATVDIRICLNDLYWSVSPQSAPQYHDYCASYKLRWHAQANIDGVVGGISLEGIITIICCILSDIGLLVRLALQQVVPFYKTYPAKVQFSLCLTLFLAYSLFLLGGIVDEGSKACRVISIMTHLAFLSALFWMNVTAFEIWRTFRHWRNQVVSRGRASLALSAVYAVGIPLAIVITALVIEELHPWSEFSPNYGEYFCWLNGSMAVAIFFVAPCSAICGMNAIFVGLTLRGLRRQRTSISEFKKSNTVTAITNTTIVVKIILLVGITWLLGLVAAMVNHQVLWIIFTITNASLGFLISAVLVLNKRVFYAVQKKCLCYNTDSIAVVSTQVARH